MVSVDCLTISMTIESIRKDYDGAMRDASERISKLQDVAVRSGYAKEDLKTTSFNVDTRYESVKDRQGNYKKEFAGYACVYRLKLSFDFDSKQLAEIISCISNCGANPELSIAFTVRNPAKVSEELLESAALNIQLRQKKCLSVVLAACLTIAISGCSQEYEAGKEKQEVPVKSEEPSVAYTAIIDVADYGSITVELDAETAPKTVENFVALANEGFYDGLTFHRIMDGFMIQGGDPDGDGTGGSEQTIKGEFNNNGVENNLSRTRGAISMARSNDYDSASSQFFIVHEDSTYLDGSYACFGYVTEGMDVVDAICADAGPSDNNGSIAAEEQPVIKSIVIQ